MTEPAAYFTITLAQLNPIVGDVTGNAAKARAARAQGRAAGADLVVLPELFIAGYPPEDLVLKPAFQSECRAAIEGLARDTADGGPAMLVGSPWVEDGKLYNACALLDGGRVAAIRFKANLPNYGVFDEKRLFARGPAAGPVTIRGIRVGVPICEDIWLEESEEYENVVECLAETGAEILIVPNGSPYARDKGDLRLSIAVARVTESGLPLIYLNQIGGQDELVFDGASFALNADLSVAAQLPAFEENITTLRWSKSESGWRCAGPVAAVLEGDKGDYAACVLGLRDYVVKNGFPGVLMGVSGGIDSALCAAIAVRMFALLRLQLQIMFWRTRIRLPVFALLTIRVSVRVPSRTSLRRCLPERAFQWLWRRRSPQRQRFRMRFASGRQRVE
jgi:NAD+ synthase